MAFTWMEREEALSSAALTVRAQVLPEDNNGELVWPTFFPRVDVDTTEVNELTGLDARFVADRREWDARGRRIPLIVPDTKRIEWVPIEATDAMNEKEINKLSNEVRGNQDTFREVIGARLPDRTNRLAEACYRRLEVDCHTAWCDGAVTQKNPETGQTVALSFGFPSSRYQTAGTAWNDAGVNAYNEFLAWLTDGADTIGSVAGAMMRRATYNAILADAPNLPNSVKMTRAQIEQRITDDAGFEFRFYINENALDVFTDGGVAYTRTKLWTAEKVALVPSGLQVGNAAFAPVNRAGDLAADAGDAGIDVRGVTIYRHEENGGRRLEMEAQINAFPIPREQSLWVIDAGV
jgi:hypothetical protein